MTAQGSTTAQGLTTAQGSTTSGTMAGGLVDWEFAKATGRRLVPSGPTVTAAEASQVVAALRAASERAKAPVAQTARLHAPEGVSPVLVVDRPGWIDANLDSLAAMLDPVIDAMTAKRKGPTSALGQSVGAKVTGGEAGALMSFLATKVLGQYDLAPGGAPRLLLVAPNIVQAEAELQVDPADFRLWVCLHEETHRVQFTAVPWLRDHLVDSARALSQDLAPDPEQLGATLAQLARNIPDAVRSGSGLAELFATPEQRARIASVTAVMSLLEGHADVVMDGVGPQVVPSVAQIRAKFQQRRMGASGIDRLLRRLLGLDAKMRQYRDGAAFVRAVSGQVGTDGFNQVWTSPETLPLPEEIASPDRWVRRIHGA